MNAPLSPDRGTIQLINDLGTIITKSQLVGCKSEWQGKYLASICVFRGCDPQYIAGRYDIMPRGLRMKSVIMLAEFRRRGGKHKVVERTADRAAIELTIDGQSEVFEFVWDEVKDEDFATDGRGETKANYSTPVKRRTMLWYRAVSDGVSVMCPEVFDEEYQNCDWSPAVSFAGAPSPVVGGQSPQKPVVESGDADPSESQNAHAPASTDGTTDSRPDSPPSAEPAADEPDTGQQAEVALTDPCSREQANCIRALLTDLKAGGMNDIAAKVKQKLVRHGLSKLDDLTVHDADALLKALQIKDIEAWASKALLNGNSQGE